MTSIDTALNDVDHAEYATVNPSTADSSIIRLTGARLLNCLSENCYSYRLYRLKSRSRSSGPVPAFSQTRPYCGWD